jgi:hypothetical protein
LPHAPPPQAGNLETHVECIPRLREWGGSSELQNRRKCRCFIPALTAKDEGCAKDMAKAVLMEGLEQRKFLADLFVYGCVYIVDGTHRANITAVRE